MIKEINFNRPELKIVRKRLRNNSTEAELHLWKYLRKSQFHGYKFWRQYGVGRYVLDFYCPKLHLAIELDGGQHSVPFNVMQDNERTKYIEALNIKVIRFWNNEILNETRIVLEKLEQIIQDNKKAD